MNSDCVICRSRAAALVENEVPGSEGEALQAHLAGCADCRSALQDQRRTRDAVRAAAPSLDPSWRRVDAPPSASTALRRPLLLVAPAAVLLLFTAIFLIVLRSGPGPGPGGTSPVPSQEGPKDRNPSAGPGLRPEEIDRLIAGLGDDSAVKRDTAQERLETLGGKAEERLRAFLASSDLRKDSEIAARVRDILGNFERLRVGRLAYVRMGRNTSVAGGGGILVLCDADGGNAVELAPEGRGEYRMPLWSPGGGRVGVTEHPGIRDSDTHVVAADPQGKHLRRVAAGLLVGWEDEDRVILKRGKKDFFSVSVSEGKEEPLSADKLPGRLPPETAALLQSKGWTEKQAYEASPDGRLVACIVVATAAGQRARPYSLLLVDVRTGQSHDLVSGFAYDPPFAFSPDGKWLATCKDKFSRDPVLIAVDSREEKALYRLPETYTGMMFPSFSRDGSKVAFLTHRGAGYELWIAGTGDGQAQRLASLGGSWGRPYSWQPRRRER